MISYRRPWDVERISKNDPTCQSNCLQMLKRLLMVLIEICYIPTRWISFSKLKIDCIFIEKTGLRRYLV